MKDKLDKLIVVINKTLPKIYSHVIYVWFEKAFFVHFEIAIYIKIKILKGYYHSAFGGHPPSVSSLDGVDLNFLHRGKFDLNLIFKEHVWNVHDIDNVEMIFNVSIHEEPLFALPQEVEI